MYKYVHVYTLTFTNTAVILPLTFWNSKPKFFVAWLFLPLSPKPAVLPLEDFSNFQLFT